MIKKIDHIGIVVRDLEKSISTFKDTFQLDYLRTDDVPEWKCKVAFFQCGEVLIELIEPTAPGDGVDFLEKNGGGIHHICFEVDDIQEAFDTLSEKGIMRTPKPKAGAGDTTVFYTEASKVDNIEIEFMVYNAKEDKNG